MIVYTARHLLPVASPAVADAAVAVDDGRITAAGRRRDVLAHAGGAPVRDLGEVALLPGLVNAHVHLELSWMREDPPPGGDYMTWIRDVVRRRGGADAERARAGAEQAVREMTARGTVAVGEVTNGTWTAPLLARSPLYAVVFLELLGFRSADSEKVLDEAAARLDAIESQPDVHAARGRIQVALTGHAAHTTSGPLLKAIAGRSVAAAAPISLHVAESEVESSFLADGSGPMADFLRERGAWDDTWRTPGLSPVEYLDRLGVLSHRTLAVHGVRLSHQDISRLQARGVTVVTCPRSNERLGVGKAPVPKLLGSGIPVAIGTDSLAGAPDLDLFAEMGALRREHPGLAPAAVLRMATLNGAAALGLGKQLGSIEAGKLALLAVVPLEPGDDPLERVTSEPERVMPLESALPEVGAS